jgi:hypothetical protein
MNQAVDPHQDARSSGQILQTVDPVAVVVGLLNLHSRSVAHGLHKCNDKRRRAFVWSLTFELTPTAEASAVSLVRDDARVPRTRLTALAVAGRGVERGVRPHALGDGWGADFMLARPGQATRQRLRPCAVPGRCTQLAEPSPPERAWRLPWCQRRPSHQPSMKQGRLSRPYPRT